MSRTGKTRHARAEAIEIELLRKELADTLSALASSRRMMGQHHPDVARLRVHFSDVGDALKAYFNKSYYRAIIVFEQMSVRLEAEAAKIKATRGFQDEHLEWALDYIERKLAECDTALIRLKRFQSLARKADEKRK